MQRRKKLTEIASEELSNKKKTRHFNKIMNFIKKYHWGKDIKYTKYDCVNTVL